MSGLQPPFPIPHSPVLLEREEAENVENEAKPRKKGEVRGTCFKISFSFSLSYSDF